MKYNVKKACIFHSILVCILSILILSIKNRGVGGFWVNGQNLLSMAIVICWQSLKSYLILLRKKYQVAWVKANLKTLFSIAKKTRIQVDHTTSLYKSDLSKTRMERSVEFNSFEKFKVKHHCPYFAHISDLKKKRFLRKSSKPGHGNLVLITSTFQVKLSKLKFKFDDIRSNLLQVLTYCFFKIIVPMIMPCRTRTEQNRAELIYTYN